MVQGKIIKGIAGFYYIYVEGRGVYECRARGIFRNQKIKPLVGDNVEMEILDEADREGNLVGILERESELIRPAVANIDQALVVFAAAKPKPNLQLLDRFLISMDRMNLPVIICFNKKDEVSDGELDRLRHIYAGCGSPLLFVCARNGEGVEDLRRLLRGHVTAAAGPSGVGKSTLTNLLIPDAGMETGRISEKIDRGKHTTRHSELFRIEKNSYFFDTPGFSSLDLADVEKEELRYSYPEFRKYEGTCRFQGCVHMKEPGCAVKEAVEEGKISRERYDSYACLFQELQEREGRRYS